VLARRGIPPGLLREEPAALQLLPPELWPRPAPATALGSRGRRPLSRWAAEQGPSRRALRVDPHPPGTAPVGEGEEGRGVARPSDEIEPIGRDVREAGVLDGPARPAVPGREDAQVGAEV